MMSATTVTTGEARLSYVHLFQPYTSNPAESKPKYSLTVLLPKSDTATMQRINAAIEAAKAKGAEEKWGGIIPPVCPSPVHDGDGTKPNDGMPYGDECKGHWVFTVGCSTDYPPQVVDAGLNPIIDQTEVYSGMFGRVNFNVYPYSNSGKKGIGFGLNSVQKLRDGDPLGGGRVSVEEAFGAPATGSSLL